MPLGACAIQAWWPKTQCKDRRAPSGGGYGVVASKGWRAAIRSMKLCQQIVWQWLLQEHIALLPRCCFQPGALGTPVTSFHFCGKYFGEYFSLLWKVLWGVLGEYFN